MDSWSEENLKFSYEQHGAYARVILKGYADTVMEILNAYYSGEKYMVD